MKKGLGSIPKGLAWITNSESKNKNATSKNIKPVEPVKTSQQGLPNGWTRATFIIQEEHASKLKALAYWDRLTVKELMDEALTNFLKKKRIKAIPKGKVS